MNTWFLVDGVAHRFPKIPLGGRKAVAPCGATKQDDSLFTRKEIGKMAQAWPEKYCICESCQEGV